MASTAMPDSAGSTTEDPTTKVLARFTATPAVTNKQYDETIGRLAGSGEWPPDGLAYHVAFRSGGSLRVSEIWDSREQFDAFGKRLKPVLSDAGIELSGEPEMLETYNIVAR